MANSQNPSPNPNSTSPHPPSPGLRWPVPGLRLVDKLYLFVLALFVLWSVLTDTGLGGLLAGFALLLTGLLLGYRYLRLMGRHLMWPVRNRLRVTYLCIGVVPILLILVLVAVSSYILTGQVASFLLTTELQRRADLLAGPAELLAATPADERQTTILRVFPYFAQQYPGMHLCVVAPGGTLSYPQDSPCPQPPAGWERTSGLVSRDNLLHLWVHTRADTAEVTVLMPLTRRFLNNLVPGMLDVVLMGRIDRLASNDAMPPFFDFSSVDRVRDSIGIPPDPIPKRNLFDFSILWQANLSIADWQQPGSLGPAFVSFQTRPSAVLSVLNRSDLAAGGSVDLAQSAWILFFTTCILFVIVEGFSLVAGVRLSRTITESAENLYEATRQVMRGDFHHRVAVRGDDQLSDLGRSFNRMSENLETLVAVSKEKERMQSELEIAREVQAGLYPKDPPKVENIELIAVSHPARMASGDYFDYLRLQDNRIVIAVGDVAGKGISAALLMASIQSIMRAQLRPYLPPPKGAADTWKQPVEDLSISLMVSRLNQQIHQFTSASKYATFICGCYDDTRGELRYTNAGHLPPLLIRNGQATMLNVDGLVVGAFPFATYEESVVHLQKGDLLVLYTDGISEPENEYGEEFGEERLRQLIIQNSDKPARELADLIVHSVKAWVGNSEQFDDITLMVVRKL